jgi:hypothetical protein
VIEDDRIDRRRCALTWRRSRLVGPHHAGCGDVSADDGCWASFHRIYPNGVERGIPLRGQPTNSTFINRLHLVEGQSWVSTAIRADARLRATSSAMNRR